MKWKNRHLFRFFVAVAAILIPCILLNKGIYGSFIFSFPIPFLWQVVYLGESASTLGLRKKSLLISIILGIITGGILGLFCGRALQFLGFIRYSFSNTDSLQLAIGALKIKFPLVKELGYQLLIMSNTFKGIILYFLFAIFIIGLGEEIFWRGLVQRKIANKLNKSAAIYITAALFALIHFYIFAIFSLSKGIVLLMFIGGAGVIWGYLYEETNNIWSVAVSHGIVAAVVWKYYIFNLS